MKNLENLPFSFLMDLYHTKEKAIKINDQLTINSLKSTYPDIFSDEFEEFIENLKTAISYIDLKHKTHFKEMLSGAVNNIH